jgi:S-adenosylmethionine hydrolase
VGTGVRAGRDRRQDGAVAYVSFLTDYGLADGFVAACHGVLLCGAPGVTIIDVSHLVPPGDIRNGAAVLAQTVGYLPTGVHLAVVDRGVGTERRALALAAPGGFLVGPDNGLLTPAAAALGGVHTAVELPVPTATPATFHGRDVFAPAAAALAAGRALPELGQPIEPASLIRLPEPVARLLPASRRPTAGRNGQPDPAPGHGHGHGHGHITEIVAPAAIEAEVVLVDRFGNVQLAAAEGLLAEAGFTPGVDALLTTGGASHAVRVGTTFGSVPADELVLYIDSAGMAAVAVNGGDAANRLGLVPGDVVRVEHPRPRGAVSPPPPRDLKR